MSESIKNTSTMTANALVSIKKEFPDINQYFSNIELSDYITESVDRPGEAVHIKKAGIHIYFIYSTIFSEMTVEIHKKSVYRNFKFPLPIVLMEEPKEETTAPNVAFVKVLLENGPFKAAKLQKMSALFRALEKAETPSEAYDLVIDFLGDDLETSTSFRYGDLKVSYSLSVITKDLSFDLKVEDRNARMAMLDLSLRLNRTNIKNIFTSVVKMMEMFK